jgi:cyanate permease
MNMVGNLGSWAVSKYFPYVVQWRGWDEALLAFALLHVIAVLLWLPINPNGVIGERAETASPPKE